MSHAEDWSYLVDARRGELGRSWAYDANGRVCVHDAGVRDSLKRAGLMQACPSPRPGDRSPAWMRLTDAGRTRADQIIEQQRVRWGRHSRAPKNRLLFLGTKKKRGAVAPPSRPR